MNGQASWLSFGTGFSFAAAGRGKGLLFGINLRLVMSYLNLGDVKQACQDDPDRVDFSQYSPELSRPFRGLRVWLPFKMHGAGAFREQLEEKLALARGFQGFGFGLAFAIV